jgi:hypothetical protein
MARNESLETRFLEKIKSSSEPNGCLLWIGKRDYKGYGRLVLNGTTRWIRATHAALLIINVIDIEDLPLLRGKVFHTCDNTSCVYTGSGEDDGTYVIDAKEYSRWGHLWIGTQSANMQDMWNKGRCNWQNGNRRDLNGEGSVLAKLNDDIVRRMRSEYQQGVGSYPHIAKLYGVSVMTAYYAIRGITWKHVV